jgi:hypothetical protein
MSVALLKSQDILLLCKLVVLEESESRLQKDLSNSLGINQSEVSTGLERLSKAHLIDAESKRPSKTEVFKFLEHAVKYFFPGVISEYTLGVPTALTAKPLRKMVIDKGPTLVWPDPKGTTKGIGLIPIHDSAAYACEKDERLYSLLTLLDAMRTFKGPRVTEQASLLIRKIVFGNSHE